MKDHEDSDAELLLAYERGELTSTSPTRAQLETYRQAARGTSIKDRRVNTARSTRSAGKRSAR